MSNNFPPFQHDRISRVFTADTCIPEPLLLADSDAAISAISATAATATATAANSWVHAAIDVPVEFTRKPPAHISAPFPYPIICERVDSLVSFRRQSLPTIPSPTIPSPSIPSPTISRRDDVKFIFPSLNDCGSVDQEFAFIDDDLIAAIDQLDDQIASSPFKPADSHKMLHPSHHVPPAFHGTNHDAHNDAFWGVSRSKDIGEIQSFEKSKLSSYGRSFENQQYRFDDANEIDKENQPHDGNQLQSENQLQKENQLQRENQLQKENQPCNFSTYTSTATTSQNLPLIQKLNLSQSHIVRGGLMKKCDSRNLSVRFSEQDEFIDSPASTDFYDDDLFSPTTPVDTRTSNHHFGLGDSPPQESQSPSLQVVEQKSLVRARQHNLLPNGFTPSRELKPLSTIPPSSDIIVRPINVPLPPQPLAPHLSTKDSFASSTQPKPATPKRRHVQLQASPVHFQSVGIQVSMKVSNDVAVLRMQNDQLTQNVILLRSQLEASRNRFQTLNENASG